MIIAAIIIERVIFDMNEELNLEELQEKARTLARGYFREGLNCAECVLKSFLDLGLTDYSEDILALATGFGGGIGHTRNDCGSVLGAVLAIGTVKGRKNPMEKDTLAERIQQLQGENGIYKIFGGLVEEFTQKYGTIVCNELSLGYEWEGKQRKKNCQELIGYCAELAVKYALSK